MANMKVWTILLVLMSFHGNSESQTDMTITMMTEIMGTAPTTFRTVPPPPPPSIPPPPPTTVEPPPTTVEPPPTTVEPPPTTVEPPPTTVEPPPTTVEPPPTPEPPITTKTPPPPPPPSPPPPPPPSSTIPPTPTPNLPTTTSRTSTRSLTTTVAIEPTQMVVTTRQRTEPINIEPNPVAESLGKIGVLLTTPLEEFDQEQFKVVIAREVNNYCSEFTGQCKGEGKTVSAKDVVIVRAEPYEQPEAIGARRRLLQEQQILVEYYVQDPFLSTNVILTTEQQRMFLANEEVNNVLQNDIAGYNGIAPVYAEPLGNAGLEGWEIALIVIGSVAAAGLVIGAVAFRMSKNKEKSKHLDLELQEKKTIPRTEHTGNDYSTVVTNGLDKPKTKTFVDEADVATQVKYKDIVAETGFESVEGKPKNEANPTMSNKEDKPNGGTSMVVTAEITSSSSGSSTSSEHGDTEFDATAQEQQEIPPEYEPPPPITDTDPGTEEILAQEEEAEVFNEFDKLVASQTGELTVNSAAFKNPGFVTSPEAGTHSG